MQEEACLGGGDVMRSSSPLEFWAERSGREHCPAGHELPIDVLVSVWQYCPQETIFACRLVCRLWNDLFLQELLRADSAQHFGALDGVQSGSVRKAVERSSARLGSRYCDVIPEDEDVGFAWMGKRLGRCEQSSGWQPQVANFSWTEWMQLCRRHNAVCTKETGMLATTSSRSGSSVAKLEGVVARMRKMAAMQLTVNSAEEWLGHLADFRRAQHNIRCCRSRVSRFPSSPSRYCQVLLLPDGGLMRLDLGVEVFYRRPPYQWGCPSAEPVKGIPSRRKVAHCTSWAPELRYPAPEGESIFYNPYVGMPFLMGGRGLEPLPLECSTSKRAMDLRLGVKDSPCLDSTAWHDLQAFLRHSRSCTMPMVTTDLFASFDFAPQVMPTTSMHNFTFAQVDVTPLPNIGWSSSRVSRLMSRLYPTEASTADVPIHIVRRNTDITESVMRRHPSAILNAVDLFTMVLMGLTASVKFEPVFAGDESHPEQEASGEEASVDASASSRVVAALSNVPHDSTVLEDGGDESPSARGVILGNLLEDANLIASCGTDGCVLLCAISRVGYRRLGQLEGVGATEVAILGAPVFQRVEGTTPIAKVEVPRHIATRLGPCHAPNYLEDEQLSGVEEAEVLLLALSMQSMAYICTHTIRRELCYMASVSSDTTMILHGYLYYAESITITLRQEIGLCSVVAIPRPLTCVRGGLNGCATWSSSPSWRPQEDGHPFFCWPFLAVGRRRTGVKVFYRRSADQQHGPRRDDEHESLFDGVRILPPTSVHGSEGEDEPIECVDGRPSPRQLRVLLKDVTAITISPSHAMLLVANDSHQVFVVAPSLAAAKEEEEEEVLPKDSLPAPTFRPWVGARQGKRMGLFSPQDEHGVTWIHRHFSPGRENESSSSSSSSSYSVYVGEGVFAGAAPTDAQTPSMRLYHPEVTSPPHHDSDAGDELADGATPRAVVGPIEVFGRGFLLDPCLHALQSTYPSLLPPPTDSQQQPRPLVFVAFVVQEKRGKLAGIRDMAVDDWKLTVITAYLDVVIYDVAALMKEGEVGGKAPTPGLQELSPLMHFPRATPLMSLGVLSAPLFSPALQTSSWLLRLASVSGLDSWKNRSRLRNCFSWQGGIFALHHVPAFMCTVVVDFEALCPSSSESDQDDESGAGGMEATPPNEEAAFASPFPETGLPLGSPFGARPRTSTSLGSRGSPRTSPRNSPRMRSLPGVRVDHSLLNVPHVPFGTHLGLRVVMQMLSPFAVASGVGALIYTAMQLDRQQGPLSAGLALWILPSLVPIEGSLVTRQQHVYQDRWIGWWLCVLRGFLLMVVVPILFVVKYDLQLYRDTTLPLRWMHVGLFCSAGIVMEALCQWMDIKVVERRLVSYRWSFTVWVILPTLALSAASPPLIGQYFDAPRHHHGTTPQFPLAVACAPIMASIVISCLSLAISSTISSNLPSLWYVVPAVIHLIIMGFLLLPCILFITNFSSYWKWRNGESREESQPQLMVAMVFVCIIASIWGIGVLWEPTRRLVRILW